MSATRGRDVVPHRRMNSSAASSRRRTSLAYSDPRLARVCRAIRSATSPARTRSELHSACQNSILSHGRTGGNAMSWDFETDPEFQAKLDWADEFVREEVEPLDLVWPGLDFTPLDDDAAQGRSTRSRTRSARQELWATHLGPELGGQGYGQLKLALLNEILGRSSWAPDRLRLPGARHRQRRDHRPLRHPGAEGALPAPAARRRAVLLLLDDRAPRRRRPDPVHHPRPCRTATSGSSTAGSSSPRTPARRRSSSSWR